MKIRIYLFAVALVGGWSSLGAAEPVPEKAARYLQLLTKRPQPGSVFERFVTEWLAEGSLEGLRAYLEERAAAASATTADRLLLGFYYARQNESEKSLETFRTALEADPENEAVWLLRAKAEARMLDFDAALKSLEKVSSEGTAEAAREAALLRARLLARSGESVRALEVIGQLAERFQEDEALQDGLLELQISEGLLAEGIGFAESMLKRTTDPYRRIQRRLRLGDLYQRADRSSDAVAAYDQCLDDAAQDSWVETEVLAQMDRIFRRKDDVAGLAEHLKKLAQENPARAAVGQARATVLVELGQGDEAVEAYQGLLEKQPGNAVLLDGYVDLLVRLDRAKDAVEVLRPLADERAGDREAQFRLIALLPQAGQPGEATKRMEEMLAKEEASELDFLRVARLYEAMEDPKEARRTYQRAAEKFADSESAQDALASFLHSNNERTAALRIWRERAAKADADGVLRVARALAARGEHEAALEVMEACKAPPADDTAWLTLKTTSAIGAKRTKLAADLVREVLRRADRADALDAALRLARQVFHPEEDVTRTLMEELRSMPEISAPERCLLADVLEGQGDLKGADAALQGAQGEGQALVARFHARLLERRYHFEAAVEKAREAIAAGDNRNADDLAFLVQLLSRIGDNAEALKTVAQWKAAAPASNRPWLEEARLLRLDDRPEAAVEVLRQAMRRFEGETAVADALAGAYGAAEKWADAQRIETQLFEDAEELAAKLGRVRKMAAAAQQRGALSALVEDMELRHQENPNSVVPLLALAEVHRYTNNYEKRRQAMMEAARLRPKDAKLLQQIAEIEVGEGDWRAAVMTLEQAMKLTQDPAPLQQQVAGLHLRFGEPETGLRMMVKLAGGAEMKAREAEQMAVTMMEAGYWAEAQDMLRLVLTRQAEDFRLRTLLGLTLMEAGDFSQAATEFAALLGARVELAEPVANPRPSIAEEMEKRSSVGGTLPPALVELYPISMAVYQASSSQRIGQRNGNGFNPGQSQTAYLPDTVADAAPFGVAYLLIAASRGDEAVRQQVEEELTAAQVRPEGLLEKFEVAPNGGLIPRSDRFDEFYQDPVYAAAMTQSPTGNRTGTVNEDQMRRLVQHYRTEYPAMAAQAAYALLKQDAQAHADQVEVLTSVVDSAKTDEWWWGAYLLGLLGNETAGSVSSEDQKKLLTCSRDWLARRRAFKDAKVRNIANYLDQLELAMLVKERDWAKLVARMQEMAAGDRNDNEASRYTSYYYGSQRIEIEPLDFPGRHAQKLVPPTILQILAAVTSGQMGEFSPADREALAVALDGGGDDRLRLGGLLLLEDEARYKPRLEKAAEAADASYDVLALAAAKATQDGKTEQAFSLLLRARDRADSMDDRGEAEGALVAAALALREQGVETVLKNHGEAVQSALLQLRHAIAASGNVSGMNELAEAMEHFDLGTEAASLRKLLASQQSAQKQMAATQGDRDPDDMEKLLKAGDKTAAVAMAVTELRRLADDILNGRNSGSRYEISNWAETLEEHHLVKDLLQASAPANAATSYRVYAEHALICSWLKDWDGAKKALEYCLEQRSRDPVLRMRMVGVILANGGDLKEALEQWQKIPERDRDQAMSEWIEELDQWEDVSVRLALGRFFIATLQQSGDESQGPMSQYPTYWQSAALNLMVEDCSEGSTWRPHVRVRPEVLKRLAKSRGKNFLPEVKEREKVAVELAELIVQRGELGSAGSAFDLLATLGLRDADEKRLKQLDEMAEALLQRGLKSDQRFRGMGYRMSSWSSSDSDFLDPVTLPFYVMLRRWSAGKPLAEDDPWFRDLASLEGPESAQWYRQSAVLFTAPEADWMTAALEAQSKLQSRANRFSNLPPLPLEVWRRRGLKISPAPIAKQIIEEQLRQGNWVDVGPFVALFDSVQQRCDPAETERFLQDCAAAFMGVPWEKAADFVSKHANPEQNGSQGSPVWRVDRFWTFCDELMDEISRIPPTVRVLFALGYNNTGYRFSRLFDYDALQPDQVEPLIAVLRDLQILADLPDLKFWFSQGNSREPLIRILASAFEITEENKGSASKQWRKVLEKENTFAATLVNQACKNSRTNTDWELLKPYVNVLSGLHEERVREVILAINTIFYPPYSRLSLSNREYLGPEMQPFWDIMDRELEREQDRILQAKTLAETGLSADAYVVRAILSVQGLAEKDHGAAVTQAKKVVDLIEAEQRTKGWDGKKTSNGYNLASQFLEKLAPNTASPLRFQPASAVTEVYGSIQSRDACPPGVMALQLELMTEPDQRRFAHLAWPEAYGWATTLTQDFSAAAGWVDARSAAASLARPFEPTLDRGSQQLAVLSYYHTAHQVPGWMLRRAQVALAEDEARRPLAEALEVALTLAEVNGFGADPLPVGSPWPEAALPVRQRLLSWMADESVNPLVRCALAAFASRSCANLDGSAEVTLAAMDLACQSLEQAWPVTGYAWLGTVRAFNRLDPTQPSWKSMATRYLTAYTQRASRDSEPRERGRGFWPIRTSVVTGLETALLLGDEARLSAWVQRFGKDFETNVGALQLLIRHRQPTYAKAIAEKILTRCDGANYNSGLHQAYRASDEEALTDVLKSFRTPLSQLLARIAVAGAPRDSFLIGHGAGGVVPHNERIAAVARDVAIFGMKTPEPTDHLFQHCDSAAGGMIEMADWAAHHSGKDPQERARALLGFSKYSSTPYRYLAAEPLKQLYTEGKIEAWKAMIDPLAKQFGEDKLKRSWAVHGVGLCLKDTAMLWARGRPVQELLPAADAALALVEKNDYHSAWGGAVNSLMFAQAIYALNDRPLPQSEALDAAVKICRGSVQKAEDLDNLVFSLCSGDANNTCSRPLEERMRLVKLLMSSNFVGTETVQRLPSPLAWMRARGVLTGDEIRAQAVPLAQLWGQTKQLPDLIGILLEKQPMAEVVQLLAPAVRDHTTDGTAGQLRRVLLAACALEVGDRKLAQEMLSFAKPTVEAWQKRDARLKTEVKKPTPSKAEIESVNAWLWPAVDAGYQWVEKQLGETAR